MDTKVKTCKTIGLCTQKNMEELGVWVYTGLGIDSIFKRYNSIPEAIRVAVKHGGALVMHNGVEIKYGIISNEIAYYNCLNTGEIIMINSVGENNE